MSAPSPADGRPAQIVAILSVCAAMALTALALLSVFRVGSGRGAVTTATLAERAARLTSAPASSRTPAPVPSWIWSADETADAATLRSTLELPAGTRSEVVFACDNHGTLRVNGDAVAQNDAWDTPTRVDVSGFLRAGTNEFALECRNDGGPAAAIAEVRSTLPDGTRRTAVTGSTWRCDDGSPCRVLAALGEGPWGSVPGIGPEDIDRDIRVPEGFVCELACAIPRELGSIVALAAAPDGSIVASGENSGLVRIRPAPAGADPRETRIETLELPAGAAMGGAHGLVFRGHDLFAMVNSRFAQGPGLYRLRDADGDGAFDSVELVRAFPGEPSEHGPHSVVVGPDGALYVVCGNHTPLPPIEHSRVPQRWREDLLLPRMWDPNGHAVGILAPGGWICRVDPDTGEWTLVAIGMRNPFDIAFDDAGELFTFDADMEWDMGAPWYRPTRILHCVSGAEFGWRSGSGKWPTWYPDSLPAVVDIGPGSPTAVLFGRDLRFPEPWRSALLVCDWTFGTIHAIALTPDGASFGGSRETFLTGKPLPIADAIALPSDGSLYFALGGRGIASSLYRVRWTGEAPSAAQRAANAGTDARALRRSLERFHSPDAPADAIDEAWPHLDSDDRFVRWAARTALEHQPIDRWGERGLRDPRPRARLEAAIAVCRSADSKDDWRPRVLAALVDPESPLAWDSLDREERHMLLRALSLCAIRLGPLGANEAAAVRRLLEPRFPSDDASINRDLCDLLIALDSRIAVARAVALLETSDVQSDAFEESMLRRSDSYGSVILQMAANAPQREQVHVAMDLREAQDGWTDELRERYFAWFERIRRTSGGLSFAGFLERARTEALERVPERQRAKLDRISREPVVLDADAPRPEGPGRHWTVDEVAALARGSSSGRDFARGEAMFRAASCAACHRFAAMPGRAPARGAGPDLTGVGNRFGPRELAEAIVEPSRAVSDQYRLTEFELTDGSVVVGRIVDEDGSGVRVIENLLAPDAIRALPDSTIASRRPASVSPMMPGLVDPLSSDELADLLAYLLSGGDPRAPAFASAKE